MQTQKLEYYSKLIDEIKVDFEFEAMMEAIAERHKYQCMLELYLFIEKYLQPYCWFDYEFLVKLLNIYKFYNYSSLYHTEQCLFDLKNYGLLTNIYGTKFRILPPPEDIKKDLILCKLQQ